ncbi:MAG: diaminopimelate epimerase [Candidatus Omnitrophica bacterium]|nr:diaminopimelate epimerase [Candidatus Omnitrophota bacterium]
MSKNSLPFTKMAGAGNDFIVISAQKGSNYKKLALKACDRSTGVGADGIIVLDNSKKIDYKMRIMHADGSEAEMCGNGVRCLAAYIVKNIKPGRKQFSIETLAGEILAEAKNETAHVRLSDPVGYQRDISIKVRNCPLKVQFIDTGVPHAVVFVNGLTDVDVKNIGKQIRYHKAFQPKGTNVNFVEQVTAKLVAARTYERGVEDETKACGTGSVASAIVAYMQANPTILNKKHALMKVRTTGGEILQVTFDIIDGQPKNVWLKGSAVFVAEGIYFH